MAGTGGGNEPENLSGLPPRPTAPLEFVRLVATMRAIEHASTGTATLATPVSAVAAPPRATTPAGPEVTPQPSPSRYSEMFPPMAAAEFEELKSSIGHRGVLQPVEYDADGVLLDGYHRLRACADLGLEHPARITRAELATDTEKRAHVVALNLERRHLTQQQRRELVADLLVSDPERSDRQVAKQVGASPTTVGAVRAELEASGQLSNLDSRTGADGRVRQVKPAADSNVVQLEARFKQDRAAARPQGASEDPSTINGPSVACRVESAPELIARIRLQHERILSPMYTLNHADQTALYGTLVEATRKVENDLQASEPTYCAPGILAAERSLSRAVGRIEDHGVCMSPGMSLEDMRRHVERLQEMMARLVASIISEAEPQDDPA